MAIAKEVLTTIGLICGVGASLWAFLLWLRGMERKRVESERNLAHALNNFSNVSSAIVQLQECVEGLTLAVSRVEILLSAKFGVDEPSSNSKIRVRR